MENLVLFHCTRTRQGECRVLKTPENPAIYLVEYFPITETAHKRCRQVHKMGVRYMPGTENTRIDAEDERVL